MPQSIGPVNPQRPGAAQQFISPYVQTKPTGPTAAVLDQFARSVNLAGVQKRTDLHVTIMYSQAQVSLNQARKILRPALIFTANILEVTIFSNPRHMNLVLLLDSPLMKTRWQQWMDIGCSYDFPEYKPHVTLITDPHVENMMLDEQGALEKLEAARDEMNDAIRLNKPELFFRGEWLEPLDMDH